MGVKNGPGARATSEASPARKTSGPGLPLSLAVGLQSGGPAFSGVAFEGGSGYSCGHNEEKQGNGSMSITLTASPSVVAGARSYAERNGMTLEALVVAYLESLAGKGPETPPRAASATESVAAKTPNEQLLELVGTWVTDPEAEKAFAEMRAIDEDMWR